ncbi:MAG: DUF429 domain-containing protein [Verrucomicrobiota bacterium]
MKVAVVGVDLAWGPRNPDGVFLLGLEGGRVRKCASFLTKGDDEFLELVDEFVEDSSRTLLAIDAPIVCPNQEGARPVDRLTHVHFGKYHAGCYPANLSKCPRPAGIMKLLEKRGFVSNWNTRNAPRLAIEVYPHTAMIRWFGLDRIIKYKKGLVGEKRKEFRRLQSLLAGFLSRRFPGILRFSSVRELLDEPWTKRVEDQIDALICALTGLQHWQTNGKRSDVLGSLEEGFLVVPKSDQE